MAHNLESLIVGGRTATEFIQDNALAEALVKRQEEQSKRLTSQLLGLLDRFSSHISQMKREAEEAERVAQEKREAFEAAQEALHYFGQTRNPLPLYRTTFDICGGRMWLEQNQLEVPNVNCKNSAWYVQPLDAPEETPSETPSETQRS